MLRLNTKDTFYKSTPLIAFPANTRRRPKKTTPRNKRVYDAVGLRLVLLIAGPPLTKTGRKRPIA